MTDDHRRTPLDRSHHDRSQGASRHSLRVRLLVGGIVWTLVALGIVGFGVATVFKVTAQDQLVDELRAESTRLAASHFDRLPPPVGVLDERPGWYWWFTRADGTTVTSAALGGKRPDTSGDTGEMVGPLGSPVAYAATRVAVGTETATLFIAVEMDHARSLTRALHHPLVAGLLLLGCLFLAAVWIQVEVGLRPLMWLTHALEAMRVGQRARLPADHPPEVSRLVDAINDLREADEERAVRAELQAGNLAHALKTDLASIAIDLEDATPDQLDQMRDRVFRTIERASRRVNHHAARARAAARGEAVARTPVQPTLERLVSVMSRLHQGRGVVVTLDASRTAVFPGDERDLEEIVGNLADNGAKWCRSRVHITARGEAGEPLVITVDDDGPGLAPEMRDLVSAPGVRLDESVSGTGLGLSIVRDLVNLHAGTVSLDTSELGGLRVTIRVPLR